MSQRALTLDEIILRHAPKPRQVKADVLADAERSRPPAGKFKTQLEATGRRRQMPLPTRKPKMYANAPINETM